MKIEDDIESLGFFEKYLTVWIFLCMILGILAGRFFPTLAITLDSMQVAQVSIPIAICLFLMIYSIMVRIDFKDVMKAGGTPKPVILTLFVNWMIKPFFMAAMAWLFLGKLFAPYLSPEEVQQYIAGVILLGIAPCTAMVLMWGHLARGNQGHNLVMVAVNSLSMLILYAPFAKLLLGMSGVAIPIKTIALSISIYVGLPILVGYITRTQLVKRKGMDWFENRYLRVMNEVSILSLLITLVVLFSFKGDMILRMPLVIGMIAVPLFIEFVFIFIVGYGLSWYFKLKYGDASVVGLVGASNHFEVSIATAAMLFGINSGAALATVVGPLIEVPIMVGLTKICLRTRKWFPRLAESG